MEGVSQSRKEQSLLTCIRGVYKASNSVLLFVKMTPGAVLHPKSMYTALISFSVLCSYGISLGNVKYEDLIELWHDFVIKNFENS